MYITKRLIFLNFYQNLDINSHYEIPIQLIVKVLRILENILSVI